MAKPGLGARDGDQFNTHTIILLKWVREPRESHKYFRTLAWAGVDIELFPSTDEIVGSSMYV